jgi:ATP-binding cassette, subfamily B, bacterial PglK
MLDILRKFHKILNPRERRSALLLFALILCNGIAEAMGVASIMPFLAVLANPQVIQKNSFFSYFYQQLNFGSTNTFLLFLGTAIFFVVVASLSLNAVTQYAIVRFTQMRNYTLSTRLLQAYLSRSYTWFLNRHSADLGKTILSEVGIMVDKALLPAAQCIANTVIAGCLIILLLLVNPWVALLAAVLLGGSYGLIYGVLRKYLSKIGWERVRANQERFRISQEALEAIKVIKAAGLEGGYLSSFGRPAQRYARYVAANDLAVQLPQFILQAIAFGVIIVITLLFWTIIGGDLGQVLPTLGVFAFAGQRLLPALNRGYVNATKMRFGKAALDTFYEDLMEKEHDSKTLNKMLQARTVTPMGLNQSLKLVDVKFWYPKADNPALQDLNLEIPAKNTVGLVGPTGAGKTTLVDVILGLLKPNQGSILVDGEVITQDNLSAWQRTLGYVPQHIFLSDDTVSANIAFGIPRKDIDPQAVERAARIAELHDFVVNELVKGYDTKVGERGINLSGGQRQLIGIARALYHDPDVLILDEATSALDNLTEKAVMQAVHNLSNKKTIILIAHRLSTVKNCDFIYILDRGRLAGRGTYSELLHTSSKFQRMAAAMEWIY